MNVRETAKNASVAFLAQGVSMLLSVIQSLIVPKLLGVAEYGYWQLFIFYIGYVGFFHFGLNDGVYLIKGGESRKQIDRSSVRSQFAFSLVFETLIALCVVIVSMSIELVPDRRFVAVCAAIFLVIQNAASYLMYVLQAMNETRLSSYSTIVARFSFLILLGLLISIGSSTFRPFVVAYIASVVLQLAYCIWHCQDILSASFSGWTIAAKESVESIRVGSKLMLANIASQLILGVLRLAIDAKWGVETFGKLSLSLSLVNFFLAFVTQAAMVLFPALRQSNEEEVRSFYMHARDVLGLAFPAIYLLYFPMVWLLIRWLPAYADSLRYFAYLIPICVFDSKMNITCTTLFKVRRQENLLLRINIATTVFCAVIVAIGVFMIGSVELSVASATLAIMMRSFISEGFVASELGVKQDDVSVCEFALTFAFVSLALLASPIIASFCYALLYSFFLIMHRRQVGELFAALRLNRQ